MCTYNGELFLREQLESIAAQTRPPDELVVCDDLSTDNTVLVVERFAAEAPFPVRIYVNDRTLGSTKNFSKAITLCEGDLIALSDQDDVWLPTKLNRLQAEFARRPTIGLVFSDAEIVDENLRSLNLGLWDQIGFDRKMRRRVTHRRALDILLPGRTVTGATMAFRAAYRELVLEIPNDLDMIHDGWIALVISSVADIALIDEPLIKYRQHPSQQIGARGGDELTQSGVKGLEGILAARRRATSYRELIEIGRRLKQRLTERGQSFACDEALLLLDGRLMHLAARSALPERKYRRLPLILREFLTLRYRSYSNGIYSAMKDLFS